MALPTACAELLHPGLPIGGREADGLDSRTETAHVSTESSLRRNRPSFVEVTGASGGAGLFRNLSAVNGTNPS